ncbi:MAG TPA: helix-turn-helix transcriptional regulator [Thermoanaerobaculia bacterium]|nr:helix-turn-helix transcriptional regulator [Thermoanaerobaculia bacterium]
MSQLSNREVERRLGWSSGYLSRLFAQDMELKIEHVLNICRAIGFAPGELFRAVFPRNPGEANPGWAGALTRLHPVPPPDGPAPAPSRTTAAARAEAVAERTAAKRSRSAASPASDAEEAAPLPLSQDDMERLLLSALRNLLLNPSPPQPPVPGRPDDTKPSRRSQN